MFSVEYSKCDVKDASNGPKSTNANFKVSGVFDIAFIAADVTVVVIAFICCYHCCYRFVYGK